MRRQPMHVRAVPDQGAEGSHEERDRDHRGDQPRGHPQLHDHDTVERADEQHRGHADRHLEQRQAQQPRMRQLRRRDVGERQEACADGDPGTGERELHAGMSARSSIASAM
jgi:hypothetical protein